MIVMLGVIWLSVVMLSVVAPVSLTSLTSLTKGLYYKTLYSVCQCQLLALMFKG